MVSLSEPLPEHYDELRRVTLALAAEVKAKRLEIEALTIELARLKRWRFGASTELADLNRRIVERLRFLQQMRAHATMLQFSLGDRVTFDTAAGRGIVGTLMRYNQKSVTVITDHLERWNVSPVLLRRAEPRDIIPTAPEPVDLFPLRP